jgi:D-alanyl-D-alanine dipeptidase
MANNLFVSYDLYSPGQNYDAVINAVKGLGDWAKVQKSLWYVKSNHSASSAVDVVWAKMDANDSIIVIDATNKNAAWRNLSDEVSKYIRDHWNK